MQEKTLPQVRKARLRPLDRTREIDWIATHRSQYMGQWVVLDGDQLIGHGHDPRLLIEKARSEGVERPLVVRIQEEPTGFTGGWL